MSKLIVLNKAAKREKIEKKKFSHCFAHLRALIFKEKKFWQLKKERKERSRREKKIVPNSLFVALHMWVRTKFWLLAFYKISAGY